MWLWIVLAVLLIILYDRKSTESLRRMQQQGFISPKGIRLPFVGHLSTIKDQTFEGRDKVREYVYEFPGTVTQFFGMTTVAVMDPQYHKELWDVFDEFDKFKLMDNTLGMFLGQDSLFFIRGERWHQRRKALNEGFKNKQLDAVGVMVRRYTQELVEEWISRGTVKTVLKDVCFLTFRAIIYQMSAEEIHIDNQEAFEYFSIFTEAIDCIAQVARFPVEAAAAE